jgi:hypothetical protein
VSPSDRLPQWMADLATWQKSLNSELSVLPETLRQLREGVANFQRITQRLLDATEATEQFTKLSTGGMTDAARRLDDAARKLRENAAKLEPDDRMSSAVEDFTDALSALAELNPVWRWAVPPRKRPGGASATD